MERNDYQLLFDLEEDFHKLDCLKCNLELIYYGMAQDTLGSDRYAVESCADTLGAIHGHMIEVFNQYKHDHGIDIEDNADVLFADD